VLQIHGFAADGVKRVAVTDLSGSVIAEATVEDNVYKITAYPPGACPRSSRSTKERTWCSVSPTGRDRAACSHRPEASYGHAECPPPTSTRFAGSHG
jgi:hypothetical protein